MENQYTLKATSPLGEEDYQCIVRVDDENIFLTIKEQRGFVDLSGPIKNNIFSAKGRVETPMKADLVFFGFLEEEKIVGSIHIGDYCEINVTGEIKDVSL